MTPWEKVAAWLNAMPLDAVEAVYRWANLLTMVVGVVTVICFAATYWSGNRIRALEGLADLRRDAEVARIDTQRAELERQLADEIEAGRLQQQIAEERERERTALLAQLRAEQKEASTAAAEAERHVANATRHVRPREITAAQRAQFLEQVGSDPKGPIVVLLITGDGEIVRFAEQLVSLLTQGGWTVAQSSTFLGVSVEGVRLRVRDADKAPSKAIVMQQGLKNVGIQAEGWVDPDAPPDELGVVIGHQPIVPSAREQP